MTQDEINALGIAFFSGKTLQYKGPLDIPDAWIEWTDFRCPGFRDGNEWRVKPAEPKKEIWCTFRHHEGGIATAAKDSVDYYRLRACWTHIPSLDREVILQEGE